MANLARYMLITVEDVQSAVITRLQLLSSEWLLVTQSVILVVAEPLKPLSKFFD